MDKKTIKDIEVTGKVVLCRVDFNVPRNKLHITKFINIPYDQFINNPPKLSKNKPIYLICYTGTKSLSLAKKLSSLGYQAYSFSGGFYVIEHPINNQFY